MSKTKPLQTETPFFGKKWKSRIWLIRFAFLIGLGFVFFYGYCWGLWGRSSLLMQYLFQCGCPVASAEARYPDEIDMIVPACQYVSSMLSPSGRLLYVREKKLWRTSTYLLNLQTNEKTPFSIPDGSNHFLTDDLFFLLLMYGQGYEGGEYLLDRTTGKQIPITKFQ